MNRNKTILISAAALLLAAVFLTVGIAVNRPSRSAGGYYRDVIDRIRVSVDHTEFSLPKDGNGEYEVTFRLTLEKTEGDFYAVLHGVEAEGLSVKSLTFQSVSGGEQIPRDLPLPAENGKAVEVAWDVTLAFTSDGDGELPFSLTLHYTSGVTRDTADEHYLEIPMKAVVE